MNELRPENVPDGGKFAMMSVKSRDCLAHVRRLVDFGYAVGKCPYVLCMGPVSGGVLHCWPEAGNIVVDLMRSLRSRFLSRWHCDELQAISGSEVRRYTLIDVCRNVMQGDVSSWDFDVTKYLDKPE